MLRNTYCTRCDAWVDTAHRCTSTVLSNVVTACPLWVAVMLHHIAVAWLTFRVWLHRRQWRALRWGFMQDVSPWATLSWAWAADVAKAHQAGAVFDFTWLAASCDDEVRAYRCAVNAIEAMEAGDAVRARHWERRREQYVAHHDKAVTRELQHAHARRSLASVGGA